MLNDHIYTVSGKLIEINKLCPADIDINDVAHHLSRLARYTGANKGIPYSVAQHSVYVAYAAYKYCAGSKYIALQGLLHDATEMFLSDIPGPVKRLIPEIAKFEQFKLWPAIAKRYKLPLRLDMRIKELDAAILPLEKFDLGLTHQRVRPVFENSVVFPSKIVPWNADYAREMFKKTFKKLS